MNELANIIRAAFKRSGLSINRLSRQADVPYAGLHAFLTDDEADLRLATASKLCAVLGLKLLPDPSVKAGKTKKGRG